MDGKLLRVADLRVHYSTFEGTVHAVNGLSFELDAGKTIGLVGESGAGKTTSVLSILRLVPAPPGKIVGGSIFFEGQNLLELDESAMKGLRGNKISMIFQYPMTSLNPVVSVGLQIAEAIEAHQKVSAAEARKRAEAMLEKVQIPCRRVQEFPHEFSGGMRQRVVIAMALACNPKLIMADEPTTALDVTIQAQVLELMKDLRQEFGTAMIMITHDLGVVGEVCDDVAVMYAGEVVEEGSVEDIFDAPRHPYTVGLFGCIPSLEEEFSVIKPIKGLMPDPLANPVGCPFAPRCDQQRPICLQERPGRRRVGRQWVRCHLYGENEGR